VVYEHALRECVAEQARQDCHQFVMTGVISRVRPQAAGQITIQRPTAESGREHWLGAPDVVPDERQYQSRRRDAAFVA
jgi:hypothetical protein